MSRLGKACEVIKGAVEAANVRYDFTGDFGRVEKCELAGCLGLEARVDTARQHPIPYVRTPLLPLLFSQFHGYRARLEDGKSSLAFGDAPHGKLLDSEVKVFVSEAAS